MKMEYQKKPFLIVGTAKAGTTSIYYYLVQHPDVFIPKKETFFFLRDIYRTVDLPYPYQRAPDTMVLERSEYEVLLEPVGERVQGEVGTGYLFHHEVSIPRIKEEFGDDVNIAIILRNPVDRAFSSYNHFIKDLHEDLSFEESLSAENERAENSWDFMWRHRALGLYSQQVQAFKENFSQVKVFRYEDLQKNPLVMMAQLFKFIGVEPLKTLNVSKQFNPSGEPRSRVLQKLLIHENPLKRVLRPIVRFFMSDGGRERLRKELKSKNLKKYQEMDPGTRAELVSFYREDIKKLEIITDMDFSEWLK